MLQHRGKKIMLQCYREKVGVLCMSTFLLPRISFYGRHALSVIEAKGRKALLLCILTTPCNGPGVSLLFS